jgi:ATP-dependent helicase HrpB
MSNHPYLVIPSLGGANTRNAKAFLTSTTDLHSIYEELSDHIMDSQLISWDSVNQRVAAVQQDKLGALILDEKRLDKPDPDQMMKALIQGIHQVGFSCLPWGKESIQLRERMQFLASVGDHSDANWPDVSDSGLMNTLEEWLSPYLSGLTRLDQLKKLSMKEILQSMMDWPQQQLLDQEAPERWLAPSGSRIRIDYSRLEEPKISLRLQELFGAMETPSIAFGRQALTIEMLSPAQRPVQITKDLASFWKNTYQEVRKDLKGRYPKHYWPDNPMEAEATRFVRPRK